MILNKKNLAKLLVVSSLLAGCSGTGPQAPNFEKDADQYFESKNYLKAIEYYEKGLKQSPSDNDLKAKLQNAKKVYVQFKVAQLDQKLSNAQVNMMLIDSLQQELNTLKLYGSFEQIQAFENKLNSLKNNIESQLASLKKQVFDYKENKEYEKLLDKLKAMVALDEKVKTSDFYLNYYNQSVNYYYDETMSDLNSGELDEAIKNFNVFKSYSSDLTKIESLQKSIEDYKKVDSLITLVESNFIQENLDEALKNSVELIALKVSNKSLTQRATQVTSKVTKELLTKAQKFFDDGNLAQSYIELSKACKIKASAKFTSVATSILNAIYDKAKEYSNMEFDGVAYGMYDYIKMIDPNFKSVFVLQRDIKDKLVKRNLLQLAISEFVTPDLNRNSGTRFTASLTSELFKNSQNDLKVIERNRLKLILDELKLQETGNVDTLIQQRGKIKGIDIFVFGDIVESSIDPQRVETKVSKKVQIGTRKVSNPLFMLYLSKPQQERATMKMPDQFIEEPEYQIISYTKGSIKKTANLIVSVRIVNIQKGEIIDAKTFEKQKVAEDNYNEGVDFAGIISDPESIVSDKVLMTDLQKESINEISQFILNSFKAREQKAIQKADLYIERREYAKAIEEVIDSMIISEIKQLPVSSELLSKRDQLFQNLVQ